MTQTGNEGLAIYGEVTMDLTDKFTLAVGARNQDQNNYSQAMTPTNQAPLYVNRDFAADPLEGLMNLARSELSTTDPPA